MTPDEWLSATDPQPMLVGVVGTASDRKLRLWACACCRRIWHLVEEPRSRRCVEVSERYAEGMASGTELDHARQVAVVAANEDYDRWAQAIEAAGGDLGVGYTPHQGHESACAATDAFWEVTTEVPWEAARGALEAVAHAVDPAASYQFVPVRIPEARWAVRREAATQAELLRCVIGDPISPCTFSPAWRTETTVDLAASIYNDRAFERLPILADALQEAGCEDETILAHCREPGLHVRGCWVVDLVLGYK